MAITTPDVGNTMFQLAVELVNNSSRSIFLTGKAGTGKTTFLKYIRETCPKQMAVVAPTGVAAINAGGVTIHSFFQIPFSPFVPDAPKFQKNNDKVVGKHGLLSRLRLTGEKKKVLEQLELLVIDEISMVRCDTLDAIDTVMRHIRKRPLERFGGVQVLFIGDMFQLPPVIKDQEWRLLSEYYSSPYFFDSHVIREEAPVYVEFNKIYRQSEERFIRLLNQVRNNELDQDGLEILEQRIKPGFRPDKQEGYIVLTTHNDKAREINSYELQHLPGKAFSYRADIKDDFPDNGHPAEEMLSLKMGAQVMFIKNDSEKSKRYFNGKIGTITELENDKIVVKCGDESEIEVKPETWENIRYSIDKSSRKVEEKVLGSFTQYPLRLAWAITIHKSQGLTFEKAIIDAGEAFAAGQVYVALSRCTSLEGLVLKSRIRRGSLFTDSRIVEFSRNCLSAGQLAEEFLVAKKSYYEKLLLEAFEFNAALSSAKDLEEYLIIHKAAFNPEALVWLKEIVGKLENIQAIAQKFHVWLRSQFQQPVPAGENEVVQNRVKDGATHFVKEIQGIITLLQQSPGFTDSRLHAKEFNEGVREIFAELSKSSFLLKDFDGKLDGENWHRKKNEFVVPPFSVNVYAGSTDKKIQGEHPALYQQLKKLRDTICSQKDLPIYMVASSKGLEEMTVFLPQTADELQQITGFGKTKVESYGQQFLEIIQQYCEPRGLSSRISEKEPKGGKAKARQKKEPAPAKEVVPKVNTKAESFRLYREGMGISDIAATRKFTIQTIQGHLAHYVQSGEIAIEELLSSEKLQLIETALGDYDGGSIIPLKQKLGDDIGYGDIRLVLAWSAFKKGIEYDPGNSNE